MMGVGECAVSGDRLLNIRDELTQALVHLSTHRSRPLSPWPVLLTFVAAPP